MPRFVILRHETEKDQPRPAHWDLMMERGSALMTWALEEFPEAGVTITGERLLDHRLEYLEYEGPLSDDRGCVSRTASGDYETLSAGETLSEDAAALSVLMRGEIVGGSELFWKAEFKLTDASNQSWRLSFLAG